ncbi:MAG: pentapeptide repeat-containing protein [Proteobacteria bacterium]|nr:pentapeptide repeat-containing protein [Pseudomonadota bacterium]
MSKKELLKSIQASDEALFNEALSNDREPTLDNASIKGAQIGAMRIHTVDCSNTEWEACIFDGTFFDSLNLQGAFFNGCSFHNCTFSGSILAEASFDGCVLHKTQIIAPEDTEALELTNCQFKECSLEEMNLLDSSLESLTITSGCLKNITGIASLRSIVLRNVAIENFDTSEMEIAACTASGCTEVPKGFTASEGKRRRV